VDAVPPGVDPEAVRRYLAARSGVRDLHDLHIWAMSTTDTALTAHLVMDELPEDDRFLSEIADELMARFAIKHPTIQLEKTDSGVTCSQSLNCAD
jgi:cobalt-zinc-cadmium efflux system protein